MIGFIDEAWSQEIVPKILSRRKGKSAEHSPADKRAIGTGTALAYRLMTCSRSGCSAGLRL